MRRTEDSENKEEGGSENLVRANVLEFTANAREWELTLFKKLLGLESDMQNKLKRNRIEYCRMNGACMELEIKTLSAAGYEVSYKSKLTVSWIFLRNALLFC
ncbi:hypothetical protein RJT34_17819 [Clitoria ternatea]|uniref:Uncharacterized protein n=1 Tax=Clitoria ternatea TaxID=43366 RepID=A0AAN9J8R7_CLITE